MKIPVAIPHHSCPSNRDWRVLNLDQPTVLIVSDDAEFSRAITGRWQSERNVPAFTLMSGDLCQGLDADEFDLAIVGTAPAAALVQVLTALESAGKPVILVCSANLSVRTQGGLCFAPALGEIHLSHLVLRLSYRRAGLFVSLRVVAGDPRGLNSLRPGRNVFFPPRE